MSSALWSRPERGRPLVLAHRGACQHAPENTLEAFSAALQQGADGVELDVRWSSDQEPVIIHDPTLERYTAGKDRRCVSDVTAQQLRQLGPPHGPLPSLLSALKWAAANGAYLNVELKHGKIPRARLVRSVLELVRETPKLLPRLLISSFDPRLVRAIRRAHPSITTGWLIETPGFTPARLARWKLMGAPAIHPHWQVVSEAWLSPWRRAGALVVVWTVNDPRQASLLAAQGVRAIITDDVVRVLDGLKS
jgi:glycerophosphoryl diester phosphodiesterase